MELTEQREQLMKQSKEIKKSLVGFDEARSKAMSVLLKIEGKLELLDELLSDTEENT